MLADVPRNRRGKPTERPASTQDWPMQPPYGRTTVEFRLPSLGRPLGPSDFRPGEPPSSVPELSRYMSIKALALHYREIITESALRHLVWQAEAYAKDPKPGLASNGFLSVIVRPPGQRKVLLDRTEFERWLTSGKQGVKK